MSATLYRNTNKYTAFCTVAELAFNNPIGTFYYREYFMGGVRGRINVTKWEHGSPSEITLWITSYDQGYSWWKHPRPEVAREMIDFYIEMRVNSYVGVNGNVYNRNLRRIAPVKYGSMSDGSSAYIYKIGE